MLSLIALFASCLSPSHAPGVRVEDGTHPFGVGDMLAMDRLSDPVVSPDGNLVAFTVRVTDEPANKGRMDVWIVDLEGGAPKRLTTHEANDWHPRFAPDGKALYFLSTRSGSSQVWKLELAGGEPVQVTKLPLDVDNLQVFPDGKRLCFTMEVYPDAQTLEETVKRDEERAASKVQARVYENLLFRHWDTWEDGKRNHVFVWDIGGGEPADLMRGMDADAPPRPFGGAEEVSIAPDGKEIAFTAKDDGRENAWTTNLDVWIVPADGSAAPRRVTAANRAQDNHPLYSPDGRYLAWLAMERPGYEADRQRIQLLDRVGGGTRSLTESWDRSPGEFVWAPDGKRIWASADHVGNHSIFAIDVAGGQVGTLVEKGYNTSPRPAGQGLVYLHDDLKAPAEIHLVQHGGTPSTPLTRMNAAKLAAARTGDYEQFSFAGANGDTVHGYLVKPVDFDPARKYPVAFLIHGGPQGSFGDHFHYRWNPQAYAGAGYAAVMVDFHGSTGYGQAFCDAIRMDWGGAPYEDLMKGLDFALAKYPFLDASRVGALGASYGGYMINWIAGQTDRFRCLVNHDGNLDERMAYFDTEELWFPEWDHGGLPWEAPENYRKHNPIEHVKSWKTPMLVIHGGQDFRVVDTQGMSTFTALQRRGIPSKLVHFPDENHWVLKPQNSRFWHGQVLGWLDCWLKGDSGTAVQASSPH
jgi:dipeptidyl aminopeptidase/acylaminoacyl peptidase